MSLKSTSDHAGLVPGSVANLGGGFDTLGVAVDVYLRARIVDVRDDGVGFDEETVTSGQGLANMRQRAEAIEGRLSLRSTPGRGTAIEVVLRPT